MSTVKTYRKNTTKPKKAARKRPRKSAQLRELAALRQQIESARDRLGAAAVKLLDAVAVATAARQVATRAIVEAEHIEAAWREIQKDGAQ